MNTVPMLYFEIGSWIIVGAPLVVAFGLMKAKYAQTPRNPLFVELITRYNTLIAAWLWGIMAFGWALRMVISSELGLRFMYFVLAAAFAFFAFKEVRAYRKSPNYRTRDEQDAKARSGHADDDQEWSKNYKHED